jgi:hypothetical protein
MREQMDNKFSIGDIVKHPNNGSYHIVIKDTLTHTGLSYYTLLNCQKNTEITLYHYDIIKFVMVSRA